MLEGERRLTLRQGERWTPADPRVYQLRATLLCADGTGDMYETPCGAPDCSFDHGGWLVAGQPVLLQGMRLPGGVPLLAKATLAQTWMMSWR